MLKLVPLVGALLFGTALGACSQAYDQRDFKPVGKHPPSRLLFINVLSTGHWTEGGVQVSGGPYALVVAPRVKERPDPRCALTIRSLTLAPQSTGQPVIARERWELRAEPVNPNEPNSASHSDYFTFVPVEGAFVASGEWQGLNLTYEPHRLRFEMQGGPTCPASVQAPLQVDVVLEPDRTTGTASWWDAIMGI